MSFRSTKTENGVRRRGVALAASLTAAVLAVGLAGCTPGDAGAEPTSLEELKSSAAARESASAPADEGGGSDDPKAIIKQRTADAIQRYKEYVRIKNETEQRGESAFAELSQGGYLGSHDSREYEKEWGSELVKRNEKQTGRVVVASTKFSKYNGDPLKDFNGHEVQLKVCIDLSGMDLVDADGKSVVTTRRDRVEMGVTMRGVRVTANGKEATVWGLATNQVTGEAC